MYNEKITILHPSPSPIVFARFVEFGTIHEAEQALQKLNGFNIGNDVRLCVKVAERQEDRQKRLAKKREDEAFLSTLYCGKQEGNDHSCVEDYEVNDAQYISPATRSQKVNTSPGSSSEQKQLCTVCQKVTAVRCSHCKAPYCSRKCQTEDWPVHKQSCRRLDGSQNSNSVSSSSGSTGSGDRVNSDGGEKKDASLTTQHQTEKCDAAAKHVTFGPSLQPTPRNPDESVMVPFSEVMSHFTSSSNLLSIPLDSPLPKEFDAVVTAVLSCTKFSLVALSHETKQALTQLQAFGEQGRPGSSLPVDPAELAIGSKCGFWTESGEFYRVEVMELQSDFISVRLFDLGGHVSLPAKSLCCLPEEFISIPCVRRRCSLLNLFTANGVGVELFVRLVAGKPVHVEHHGKMHLKSNPKETFSLCKIQSLCRQVDIYEVVRRSPFVERKQLAPEEKLTEMAQKSHQCSSEHPASTEGQYRIVHLTHKIPTHQPPNRRVFEIIPTIVTSPAVIWAHVAHPHLGNLTRMEKDLNLHYRGVKDESYAPTTAEICVAKLSEDQQFYRAEVLCVNNNGTVEVLFIDFGNRATVTTGQLRYLEPIFLTLPKQAVQFSLAGITPSGTAQHWSDNVVAYLKGKITRNRVRVEIVSATQTAFLVKMFDPDSPKKVLNDAMVALGHAQFGQGKPPSTPLSSLRGVSLGQRRSSGSSPKDTQVRSGLGDLKQMSPRGTVTTSFPNSPHADETSMFGQATASLVESASQPLTPPTSPPSSSPTKIITPSPKWSALLNKRSPISAESQTTAVTQLSQTTPQLNPPTELPEVCKVQVTDVTDPWSFCVQEMDHEKLAALNTLMLELQEAYRNPFHGGFQVQVGAPCCARYDADECWYRCQVLENVGGNRVKLHYVDFGNVECISMNEVYSLDSKFTQLPSAGVLCSLNAVKPVSRNGWSSEAVQVFKSLVMGGSGNIKIITARVASESTAGITEVNLFTEDGGQHSIADTLTNIAEELIARGLAVKSSLTERQVAAATELSQTTPQPSQTTPQLSQTTPQLSQTTPQLSQTTPQLNPPTGLPEVCKVQVTDITDPWSFCVQEMDREKLAALNTLMLELQEAYRNPFHGGFQVQVGAPCCARYDADECWYRCQVLENVGGNRVKLHYVDFGNVECISMNEVYSLDSKFTQLPSAGVLCSLNAVKPVSRNGWSSEAVQVFKSLVMGGSGDIKIITARVVSVSTAGITEVDLFIDEGGQHSVADTLVKCPLANIAEELIARGLAVKSSLTERQVAAATELSQTTPQLSQTTPQLSQTTPQLSQTTPQPSLTTPQPSLTTPQLSLTTPQPSQTTPQLSRTTPQLSQTTPQLSQTPQLNPPTGLPEVCKVHVTDITDPWSFCVQEMDREKLAALNTLMLELQEAYRNPFQYGGFQVQVGAPCCARYDADECWYRCQVLENVGGNRVKLHYVDFGSMECISVNEVYSLDSKFTQLPSAGVLCSLNAVKPVFQTGWSSEAVQVFKSLVMGGSGDVKIITAQVVSKSTAGITEVDLFTDDGGQHSIADTLVKSQLASAVVENIHQQLEGTQLSQTTPQPSQTTPHPSQTTPQPSQTTPPPSQTTPQPSQTTPQPSQTTPQPSQTTPQPSQTTPQPSQTTPQPSLTTPQPSLTTPQPSLTTPQPSLTTPQPSLTTPQLSQTTPQLSRTTPQLSQTTPQLSQTPQLNPPTGLPEVCKVHVTDITDPWSFCVQEMDREKLAALNTLMLELQEAYRNPFQYGGFQVQVGAPCCARYDADECWYRCQVLENVGGNRVKLHYVDFGSMECISVNEVYSLDSKFTQLPSAGVLCSLNAVKPVFQTGWSSEAVQVFKSLVMGGSGDVKIITARVVSESTAGITKIDLFTDDGGQHSIADMLVNCQLASAVVGNIHRQLEGGH